MKCIRSKVTGVISRVADSIAKACVEGPGQFEGTCTYVSKKEWKAEVRDRVLTPSPSVPIQKMSIEEQRSLDGRPMKEVSEEVRGVRHDSSRSTKGKKRKHK